MVYYEANPPAPADDPVTINIDGIVGSITRVIKQPKSIEGVLDSEARTTYATGGQVIVCSDSDTLLVENNLRPAILANSACGALYAYSIASFAPTSPLDLEALSGPVSYKLAPANADAFITDKFWHLFAQITLDYGEVVSIDKKF